MDAKEIGIKLQGLHEGFKSLDNDQLWIIDKNGLILVWKDELSLIKYMLKHGGHIVTAEDFNANPV